MQGLLRSVLDNLRAIVLRGRAYKCPICERSYCTFLPANGTFPSYSALCPGCGSAERHRILWLCLQHLESLNQLELRGKMLHVAPERSLARRFKTMFDYLSVDIDASKAMEAADLTRIPFSDDHFDAIVCNHVLEHIPNDRRAMLELYRVLKPGGWAALLVPMTDSLTDEDPAADPKERTRRFGQEDHVRLYGRDYLDRLREAGFRVTEYGWKDFVTSDDAKRFVIHANEEMIFGWKS